MVIAGIYLLAEKIYNYKFDNANVDFPTQFCLGSILKKIPNKKKYQLKEITMIFQSNMMLLMNLKFQMFINTY